MRIQANRRQSVAILILVLAVLALSLVALAGTAESRATGGGWECPAGHICHVLLQPGSELYLLCAGSGGQPGKFRLTSNGADSWHIECIGRGD